MKVDAAYGLVGLLAGIAAFADMMVFIALLSAGIAYTLGNGRPRMGIGTGLGFVLLVLLGGVLLTVALENVIGSPERGAARSLSLRSGTALLNADRWLLPAGPIVALAGVLLGTVVLPFGPGLVATDLGIGVFCFIVVVDFVVLGIALTGWGANTPDAVESCYRIVAQLVSYLVPLGLAYAAPS